MAVLAVFAGWCVSAGAETFPLPNHPKVTAYDLMDQTDNHNELLTTREWTAQWNEHSFAAACCAFDVCDAETGSGRVFLRLAPLPHARPVACDDFRVDSLARTVEVLSNGYPFVTRAYRGGRVGRIRAFRELQRELRPYRPGRDGRILSNNWGAGFSDTRLNEDYALREIEAGAKLGVEVIELDDGWQKGRSANSLLIKDRKKEGVWNGYWAFDPNFWDADPVRFAHGLDPLVAAAKAHGMDFGLWFGPDSSNDAANWEKDADRLLAYYRTPGIRYFKIDSMKSFSPLALAHQRAMFDKILAGSASNVVFDLDVTAEIRPGYFGLPDIGTLFVENRYAKHCSWWPHQTLKNLWSLSEVVDPVRLRMEFLDPKQHADRYAARYPGSPLRPELWKGDAVFATVMLSSPLAWMEIQGLRPETVAEMAPVIATWKRERDRLHTGTAYPVGAKPDGFSWTGFVTSAADGQGGYVLLFRECAEDASFTLDLAPYLAARSVETLAGTGAAKLDGAKLTVEIPEKLGYLWLKVSSTGLDRTRFNVGTYRFGDKIPGFRTEQHVKELKEAGVDFIASMRPGADAEAFYRTMDLFEKHGVGAIPEGGAEIGASCPVKAFGRIKEGKPLCPELYLEAAKRFRNHPAIWGVDVGDEPHGMDLPNVGKAVEMCRRLFPTPFLYVNLFPSYARLATNTTDIVNSQLGSLSYKEYIEDYCRYVPLDYISFDIYPYSQTEPKGVGVFFNNLKIAADACVNHGKALWLVGQANTWFGRKPLAENKMRYQAYAGLAFGAEVMTWACWTKGWWTNNVYSATGEKTVAYDRVKKVNAELHLLGDECLKYRRVATHFVDYAGKYAVYLNGSEAKSEPAVSTGWFRDVSAADGEPILVSELVPRDARAPGAQAIFVMASEDPYDEHEKERVIRFRSLRHTVEALGGEGPIHVRRDSEGFSTITIKSNRGALVWTK